MGDGRCKAAGPTDARAGGHSIFIFGCIGDQEQEQASRSPAPVRGAGAPSRAAIPIPF